MQFMKDGTAMMHRTSFKIRTIPELALQSIAVLTPLILAVGSIIGFFLERHFFKKQAKHIVDRQSLRHHELRGFPEVQEKIRHRISYCAIFKLFDDSEILYQQLKDAKAEIMKLEKRLDLTRADLSDVRARNAFLETKFDAQEVKKDQ